MHMIEVEMSKDIHDFAPKILGPFTKRQLVCSLIGAAIAYPIGAVLYRLGFSWDVVLIVAAVCALPALLCGFKQVYGLNFETYFIRYVIGYFLKPTYRKYKVHNTFSMWETQRGFYDKNGEPRKIKYVASKKYRPLK